MADSAIVALQATALTGRCDNAFFRQKQLKSLHDALRQDSNTIKDAIKADTRVSEQEATTEVALALELVKEYYSSINQAKEREQEYRVANGKNANDQKQPWGVVYIEPQQSHTPFYSAIAALSAALAAGNCIALKVRSFFIETRRVHADELIAREQPPLSSSTSPYRPLPSSRIRHLHHRSFCTIRGSVVIVSSSPPGDTGPAANVRTACFAPQQSHRYCRPHSRSRSSSRAPGHSPLCFRWKLAIRS